MESKNRNNKEMAFQKIVKEHFGGETISFCYQCGTCTSSCPVSKLTEKFNPRKMINLSLSGEKKEILTGESIWLCCSCYNCQERCPQEVEIAEVILALRNIAIKKGNIPDIYSKFLSTILNDARITPISKFIEKKRSEVGLPPLQVTGVEDLRKILANNRLHDLQQKKEGK